MLLISDLTREKWWWSWNWRRNWWNLNGVYIGLSVIMTILYCIGIFDKRKGENRNNRNKNRIVYPGLYNVGNLCYINAILQALSCINFSTITSNGSKRTGEFIKLLKNLNKNIDSISSPYTILSVLGIEAALIKTSQQDAEEFLRALLRVLGRREEKDPFPNKSSNKESQVMTRQETVLIMNTLADWEGIEANEYHCNSCHYSKRNLSKFDILTVGIEETKKFLLDLDSKSFIELLDDYICPKCQSRGHTQKTRFIQRMPKLHLFVHIQRIVFKNFISKSNQHISFPKSIGLMRLRAIIEHQGSSPNYGHYVCYKRSPRHWVYTSDTCTELVNWKKVSKSNASILFYSK